jgi:uncharacterized membrane protein
MNDIREASLEHDPSGLPGGALGQSIPFAMLAAGGVWLSAIWHTLPERMPAHWDLHGRPDRFVSRVWYEVSSPLLLGALACAFLLVLAVVTLRAAPRGAARKPSLRLIRGAGILIAGVCCAVLVPMTSNGRHFVPTISFIAAAVLLFAAYGITLFAGYRHQQPLRNPRGWRSFIYADRDDPALLVPKRYGIGYTVNFGHPAAIPLMALFAVLPIAGIVAAVCLR